MLHIEVTYRKVFFFFAAKEIRKKKGTPGKKLPTFSQQLLCYVSGIRMCEKGRNSYRKPFWKRNKVKTKGFCIGICFIVKVF